MDKQEVLALLKEHKPILEEKFGVVELALFGSFARDQATETSDIDILVKFDVPDSIGNHFEAASYLEDLLGRTVDLVLDDALRPEVRPYVEKDINLAEKHELIKEWRFYIRDMVEFCEKALSYTNGMERAEFFADRLTYDATLRNIQLIGEAAQCIPDEVTSRYPDIPWDKIIGTRHHLVHNYRGLIESTIWDIIQQDIPALLPQLEQILADYQPGGALP